MRRILLSVFVVFLSIISGSQQLIAQCNAPSISSFSPVTGFISSKVTINGSNFDPVSSNNTVYFGATKATVLTATATKLEVRVPPGLTYAPISVKNGCGLVAVSRLAFNGIFCGTLLNASSFNTVSYSQPIAGGYHMSSQDLDGDGKPELLIIGFTTNTLSILRNTSTLGNISFATPLVFTFNTDTRSVNTGDFDGDGKIDLVVSGGFGILLYKSNSTVGALSFASPITVAGNPRYQIAAGDINTDGKLDIVFTDFSNNVSICRNTTNNGVISFTSPILFNNGYATAGLSVNDMDGDGVIDILTSCPNDNKLSLIRNTTEPGSNSISMAAPIHYGSQNYPYRVYAADFDKDGKMDMATNNHNQPSVSIYRNTSTPGNISFTNRLDYPGLSGTYRFAIGDADGDGMPDIVTKYTGSGNFSIFKNVSTEGNIAFANRIDYPAQAEVSGIVIGDLDGDYFPDIATAGISYNQLRIHRNNTVIADVTPPTTLTKNITVYLDNSGVVNITPDDIDNGSGDACGIQSMTIDKNSFNCSNLGPNNVTLTVTDRSGNQSSAPAVVTVLAIKPSGPTTFCSGGSVVLTASQGTSYLWNTGATTQSITANSSGTYSVTITGIAGCPSVNSSLEVKMNNPPTQFNVSGGGAYCVGQNGVAINLSGSENSVTYYLQKSGMNVASIQGTGGPIQFNNVIVAGTYTVSASTSSGAVCSNPMNGSVTVRVNPLPAPGVITADGQGVLCDGDSLKLTATNISNYAWSNGKNTQSIYVTQAGSYTVTTTDQNGCSSVSAPFTATIKPKPSVVAAGATSICPSTPVQLNAAGSGGEVQAGNVYKLCLFDAAGGTGNCSFDGQNLCNDGYDYAGSFSSYTNQLHTPTTVTPQNMLFNVYFTSCGAGDIEFNFYLNDVLIYSTTFNQHACVCEAPSAGTYPLSFNVPASAFMNAWSNSGTNNIRITTTGGDMYIAGETVELGATSSWYTWQPVSSLSNPAIANPIATPSVTTNYKVTYTAPNGCTASDTVTVAVKNNPPTAKVKNITVALNANGNVSISATDINDGSFDECGNISLAISSGKTTYNCSDLGKTLPVELSVTDEQGNVSKATALVTVTDPNDYCNKKPVAVCKPIILNATSNCAAPSIATQLFDNGSFDPDGDPITFTVNHIGPYSFGTTNVTLTVSDNRGASATCTTTVTVVDNTAPAVTPPAPLNLNTNVGTATAVTNLINPAATDNCAIASITNNAPAAFPIGTTIVKWTVTDIHGNVTEVSQNVVVTDNEKPIISGPADIIVNTDIGLNTASAVSLGVPTVSDNDQIVSVTNNAPATFPMGLTNVIWTVTDKSGNVTTKVQTVTVLDKEKPKVTGVQTITVNAGTTGGATNVSLGNVTPWDNDMVAAVTNNAPSVYPVGTTNVTWTITDRSGNVTTAIQQVIVVDEFAPVVTPPANIIVNTDGGLNTASNINLGIPAATDNDGIASITNDAPNVFPMGVTTVTWTVTDRSGNVTRVTQTVTVLDKEKPSINGPADLIVNTDQGLNTASALNLGIPVASDNDQVASVTNNAPSVFPMGVTEVIWTVTDRSGNVTTKVQKVTVLDKEKPQVSGVQTINVNTDPGAGTATNVSLGNITTWDNDQVSTVTNDAPLHYPVGSTNVTWIITDRSGNVSTAVQQVIVSDKLAPTAVPPANLTVNTNPGLNTASGFNLGTPIVSDNDGIASVTNDAPNVFPIGTTTVTWTIKDKSGNVTRVMQTVTVLDKEKPTVSLPADLVLSNDLNYCLRTNVNLGTPIARDNDQVATITNDAPSTFPVGTTNVTWTVTDRSGNVTTAVQKVTVNDTQNPTITAPANITVIFSAGLNISLGTPITNDNCGVKSVANNAPATFTTGTTTVIWTVTDNAGNTATATQIITVTGEIPTITAPANIEACDNGTGNSKTLTLSISNNNVSTVNYILSGAMIAGGSGQTVTKNFPIGTTTITWTVRDIYGNVKTATSTVIINPTPTVSVTPATGDAAAYCNNVSVTATSAATGLTYAWFYNGNVVSTNQTLNLTAANPNGNYSVIVTNSKGCKSTNNATYNFDKEASANSYTIYAFKMVKLHHNNFVNGSIGVRDPKGSIDINKYSSIPSPNFVKAANISVDRRSIVPNRIYAPAIINLPAMQVFTGSYAASPSYTVKANATMTLTGNYKDIRIGKGANVTITGTVFRSIDIDEGAKVTFTSSVLNIEDIRVGKGPNTSYTYVYFATDASVRVSKQVKIEERSVINPTAKKVTFYLGDVKCDTEKFMVLGGDSKIIANVYVPNGMLKVNGGCYGQGNDSDYADDECDRNRHAYGYHNCSGAFKSYTSNKTGCGSIHHYHSHHICNYGKYGYGYYDDDENENCNNHEDDNDNEYCHPTIMTGFFIAESIQSTGKNVIWNGYNCSVSSNSYFRGSESVTSGEVVNAASLKTEQPSLTAGDNRLEVYPVPSAGVFDLRILNAAIGKAKVEVIGTGGAVAEARTVEVNNKLTTVNFNLTNKAQGMYHIRVVAADGKLMTINIMIKR